jgi:MarR family
MTPELHAAARAVLEHPDPLILVDAALRTTLGGDIRPPMITYLTATTRLLELRPGTMTCHALLQGPPSVGKTATLTAVRRLLPPEAMVVIEAGSPHVLIYGEFDLRHKALFVGEADSLPAGEDNPAASAIRNLLTDGSLHYQVVVPDRATARFVVRTIEKAGPTVLITTATRPLGEQLMSRLLVIELPDDHRQLQAVLAAQARLEVDGVPPADPGLVAFQAFLQELAPISVFVPFAPRLADALGSVPSGARLSRDFAKLLGLVKAVAICRIGQRDRDERGRVIATGDDYDTVRDLAGDMYARGTDDVGRPIREAVRAVAELPALLKPGMPVTVDLVARHLGVHKSTASRRVADAEREGWLVNRETSRGRRANLALGNTLQVEAGLPDLRLRGDADPPVRRATVQPAAGRRNASTSARRAAQMRPTSLLDSEAMQMASTRASTRRVLTPAR